MKILVLDDHPHSREGLHAALAQSAPQARVVSAASVAEGLELLASNDDVTVVLLDAQPRDAAAPQPLTRRQHEVIDMLGRGLSNKQIARAMGLAERTVKSHVSAVLIALQVRNRTEAVLAAQRCGLLAR